MNKGFFITGTDTGVGKTVVTAALLAGLRQRGVDAVTMKPVQSGAVKLDGRLISEDVRFHLSLVGTDLEPSDLNCYCLPAPVSPHLAAELCGVRIEPKVIMGAFERLQAQYRMVLVEGAGGLCVPLSGTGYTVADLVTEMGLPLIVVARAGLGTINHTVLTVKWAQHLGLEVRGVIVNGCHVDGIDKVGENSISSIIEMTGVPILGRVPVVPGLSVEANEPGNLLEVMQSSFDWEALIGQEADR